MNTSFEELIQEQKHLGNEAERLISNFKKDSKARKTLSYYERRSRELEDLRKQLDLNHKQILAYEEAKGHEYIKNQYFEQIMQLIERYTNQFIVDVRTLEDEQAATHSKVLSVQATQPAEDIRQLVRQQRALGRALLRNIKSVQTEINDTQSESYYRLKVEFIEGYLNQLKVNNDIIWQNVQAEEVDGYHIDDYYNWQLETQPILAALYQHLTSTVRTDSQQNNSTNSSTPKIRLPEITLPTFSGDPLQWIAFKDLYIQLIHSQSISEVQKMFYLTANLSGEPLNLIRHLPITSENYNTAWELLSNRYDNKRVLVTSLLNKLLAQPIIRQPTSTSLKSLHDITKECINGLKAQNLPTEHWDAIIVHLTLKKLDATTLTAFEHSLDDCKRLLSLKEVLQFLEHRFLSMETLTRGPGFISPKTCAPFVNAQCPEGLCKICKEGKHQVYLCKRFLQEKIVNRWQWVKKLNLCNNCLKPGHQERTCTARHCTKCSKRHNTLLHLEREVLPATSRIQNKDSNHTIAPVSLVAHKKVLQPSYVLLGTARIKITSERGSEVECRALLDPGSQVSLISEKLVKSLGLRMKPSPIKVEGVGRHQSSTKYSTTIRVKSRITAFEAKLEAHILSHIVCDQPSHYINIVNWNIPNDILLADPDFNKPGPIDCLLGAEIFFHLLSIGQIKLMEDQPILQNTVMGWVVSGKIKEQPMNTATCGVLTNEELDDMLQRFWKLEEIEDSENALSPDEKLSESHFCQYAKQTEDGRFMVKLPFKENLSLLGESKFMAYNRFMSLEKRLAQKPEIKQQYIDFMQEYIDLNHMSKIDHEDIMTPHYFIPHHYVLRPDSSTTKLRVVFDASAKTTSNMALNDLMHTGRVVQSELFSILLRFRLPRYVLKTDIEKMYRQILVDPQDRKLQLIMWRNSQSEPIQYYQLNTVTYGTRAAPFLATRCLLKLAEEHAVQYPLGSKALKYDFYVDDGLTGADSLTEAIEIKNQLIKIVGAAKMNLRKWCSNNPKIMEGIPIKDQEVSLDLNNDSIKTMGLIWLPRSDELCIKAHMEPEQKVTKRIVLSELARIFDPLGLVGPVVVTAKIYIQQLWQLQLQWDDKVPDNFKTQWISFREELANLDNTRIPRHVFNHQEKTSIQLHAFADASEKAYGAAIYIRTARRDKSILVRLLCSKSRVAPIKKQTIPRLELCAALLAAELMARVKQDLNYYDKPSYYWTDSQIVLSWLNQQSSNFHTFVANRVSKIQRLSEIDQWRHVPTAHNPADVLSRGLSPKKLTICHIWFLGPLFLHNEESHWPSPFRAEFNVIDSSEHKNHIPVVASTTQTSSIIYNINSRNNLQTLQHVICYVLRFINNCRKLKHIENQSTTLSPVELNTALNFIIKEVQQSDFQDSIKILKDKGSISNSHFLSSLSPFLDENGIIRVGGRIELSSLPYDAKHPMLLPYNDPIVKLIMEDTHKRNLHCGPQALLSQIRQQFWPIKGKIMARSIVNHCVRCTRAKPKLFNQLMGQLPAQRVEPSRPFLNTGVDYCGPFWVHFKIRGKRPQKAYIAVFCCFATKAVHLELVTDLTTDAFLGALKRFISRRGYCKTLFCDNATNFLGAKNQLSELNEVIFSDKATSSIINSCNKRGITFKFIPPRSPHFGGLWEAAVKSAKHLLVRSTSTASLTYEELETVITEVEAILNSRPLTPISSNPNDLTALTPGHFIIGEPLTSPIDTLAQPVQHSLRDRWKLVSQLKHQFWDRWTKEYLSELQVRHRWKGPITDIKPDTMVIIKEDNTPILHWPLGRITKIYKGEDGIVRVADVKTANGTFKRPIHRLAPLFPEDKDEERRTGQLEKFKPMTNENDPQPSKKRRLVSAVNCLFLLAILLPMTTASHTRFIPIRSNPGLHFENIGTTKRIVSNWKLLVYIDLQPFYNESKILHERTSTLEALCDTSNATLICNSLINYFHHVENEIDSGFKFLPNRIKRGAINIVGNIANSLFGVLDSNYADHMTATIKEVKANEQHLNKLLKNQTSLIDATLNIIKHNQSNTKNKFDELDNAIKKLAAQSQYDKILTLCVQLLALSSNLHKTHSSIINLLVDTHHGRINPGILTPQQLSAETQKIRANLPPGLSLPVSLNDIGYLYSLTQTVAVISDEHVICTINIPLVDQQHFDLFYLTPVPQSINNTLIFVRPTIRILALNEHRDEFFPITDAEFKECANVPDNIFICPNIMAIHQRNSDICKCELHLFSNESYSQCKLEQASDKSMWQKLFHQNQWIVATRETLKMSTVCGHETAQIILRDTGFLQLDPECTIKNDFINIRGQQTLFTNIKTSHTSIGVPIIDNHIQGEIKTQPYVTQWEEITQLHEQLRISNLFDLPTKVDKTSQQSLLIGSGALILIVIIIVYLVILRVAQHRKSTPPVSLPQPRPRRRSSWRISTT